jgi:hypothetical protein
MSEHKADIIKCTMPHEMKQDAVDCVKRGLQKYNKLVVRQYTDVRCLVAWL